MCLVDRGLPEHRPVPRLEVQPCGWFLEMSTFESQHRLFSNCDLRKHFPPSISLFVRGFAPQHGGKTRPLSKVQVRWSLSTRRASQIATRQPSCESRQHSRSFLVAVGGGRVAMLRSRHCWDDVRDCCLSVKCRGQRFSSATVASTWFVRHLQWSSDTSMIALPAIHYSTAIGSKSNGRDDQVK